MPTVANITVEPAPNSPAVKLIHISGELDESNLPELAAIVDPLVQDPANTVLIFEMKGLEFMSSKIIGYLAGVYNTLSTAQRRLVIADVNQIIKDILTLVGLDQLVKIYPTLDEAIKELNA